MLERVGLGHLGERYPNELSGGEQQRVALARALVGGVGLLLFDEPLSNLDADMREQLRLAISTLARDSGATSVYITHDQSEAFSLADRVGVLRDGRIVQVGPPEELYLRPASPFVARFTGICSEMPVTLAGAPTGAPPSQRAPVRLAASAGGAVVTATLPRPVRPGRQAADVRAALGRPHREPGAAPRCWPGSGTWLLPGGATSTPCPPTGRSFTRAFSEHRWERGATVGVKLSPEGCLVLAGEGSFNAKPRRLRGARRRRGRWRRRPHIRVGAPR